MDIFYTKTDNSLYKNQYKNGHYAGRRIIEYCAKNIYKIKNPELIKINNKPHFKHSSLFFSISHTNNIAAVCFDENPVGFDVEYIKVRDYEHIVKRMNFTLEENSLTGFYKCWTEYEAAYKLQGDVKYRFCDYIIENYLYSIASSNKFKLEKVEELFF